jgi:hypothetical protein
MPLLDTTLDIGMNAIAAACSHVGLASADPGSTGLNATSHARVAAGWSTAANGDIVLTNKAFTGGAASGPVLYATYWSAITGGVYRGSQLLTGDTSSNAAGQYTINSLALNSAAT